MGYDRWAAKHNLKQMAATVTAYQQSGFSSPEKLDEACSAAYTAMQKSITELKNVEKRLNGKRGCNGRCLPIPRPAPSWTGYDENIKRSGENMKRFVLLMFTVLFIIFSAVSVFAAQQDIQLFGLCRCQHIQRHFLPTGGIIFWIKSCACVLLSHAKKPLLVLPALR